MRHVQKLPDYTPIKADLLSHLAEPHKVSSTLSLLMRHGELLRIERGVYMRPLGPYGMQPLDPAQVLEAIGRLTGEKIVPCGALTAYTFGLTRKHPTEIIHLTSGPTRKLRVGAQTIFLRHAPRWQLAYPDHPSGNALRALAWTRCRKVSDALPAVLERLSEEDVQEIRALKLAPRWISERLNELAPAPDQQPLP